MGPRTVTTKYLSEIRGFQFSVELIVYSTFNTIHFPGYKTLHYSVYEANLFHSEHVEVAIAMCYKFQRIVSNYVNFSEILGKKSVKEFQFI